MNKLSAYVPASVKATATSVGVGAIMLMNTVAAHAEAYRPTITPDWNNPATSPLNKIAGVILAISLILTAILTIIAIILFVIGKVFHQGKAQEKGMSIILWSLAGAVGLVSVSGLIFWATSDFQIG